MALSLTTLAPCRKVGIALVPQFYQLDAAALDRLADHELAIGRHRQAERLAIIAHELRCHEVAP